MKRIFVFSIMLIFTLAMVSGCRSTPAENGVEPEEYEALAEHECIDDCCLEGYEDVQAEPRELTYIPLTPALLHRLGSSVERMNLNLPRLQLVVSGGITMETSAMVIHGLEYSGVNARIRNEHIRRVITLNDTTMGEVLNTRFNANELIIYAGFEEDESIYLSFINTGDDPHSFFYLQYIIPEEPIQGFQPNRRGLIMYGGELFTLSYPGNRSPHLLLVLSEYDEDLLFTRTLPGRVVN